MKSFDALILGAGPAGLTAALYLVRGGMSTARVEKGAPGGQVLSTAEIENYPGFPKGIKGWELADMFSAHLDEYPVERLRGESVSLEIPAQEGGWFEARFAEDGESVRARGVIVCTGAHHRALGAPGEDRFTGRGVSYCAVCDGNFYRGKNVAVVGGGNSALEEALYLARIVDKVYLIHRREGFRGSKVYVDKIAAMPDKIELVTSHVIDEIRGGENVDAIAVRHVGSGKTRVIPVEGLFIYVGMQPLSGFLPAALDMDAQGFVRTDAEMRTNLPGLFAAGDVRAKLCRQVSSAVGDGATAATAALSYLERMNG